MPESRRRDKATYTPPSRTSKSVEPNPTWWAPTFSTLLIVGLVWIVVYYVSATAYPIPNVGVWNLVIGFAVLLSGFVMAMRWR